MVEVHTMLISVCKEHPRGRLSNAICLQGHSIRVCIEPDCVDQSTSCPMPGCGRLVALARFAEEVWPLVRSQ